MLLNFDLSPDDKQQPASPDGVAETANEIAQRATDAAQSFENSRKAVNGEMDHPIQQKLINTPKSMILLCGFLTLGFLLILCWEWTVSREMYEVLFPAMAWLPFFGCVGVGFYASVCLGESSTHFSLFSLSETSGTNRADEDSAEQTRERLTDEIRKLYARSRHRIPIRWMLHPVTGVVIASLFLWGIYLISTVRVQLSAQAGESADMPLLTYLPVVLYAIEILLGIPTFFFIAWLYNAIYTKQVRITLSQQRDTVIRLRHQAVSKYNQYLLMREEYNRWAEQNGRSEREAIPPNAALCNLLAEEFGTDFLQSAHTPSQNGSSEPIESDQSHRTPRPQEVGAQPETGEKTREADLIHLLDEQIHRQNRGL